MHVTDFPHMAPSVCCVCEGAEPGATFADTNRNTGFAAMTHLDGRKYVCSNCARDVSVALGLFDEAKKTVEDQLAIAESKIADLEHKLTAFTHVADAVDTLAQEKLKAVQAENVKAAKAADKPAKN